MEVWNSTTKPICIDSPPEGQLRIPVAMYMIFHNKMNLLNVFFLVTTLLTTFSSPRGTVHLSASVKRYSAFSKV